jgi:hypothetical protein
MSIDDRVTALEQGLRGVQTDFLVHLSENNRHMITLNKVITQQEANSRDLDHNLGMLLGVVSGQETDVKEMKARLFSLDDQVGSIDQRMESHFETLEKQLRGVDQRFDQRLVALENKFDQVLQQLALISMKLDQGK